MLPLKKTSSKSVPIDSKLSRQTKFALTSPKVLTYMHMSNPLGSSQLNRKVVICICKNGMLTAYATIKRLKPVSANKFALHSDKVVASYILYPQGNIEYNTYTTDKPDSTSGLTSPKVLTYIHMSNPLSSSQISKLVKQKGKKKKSYIEYSILLRNLNSGPLHRPALKILSKFKF